MQSGGIKAGEPHHRQILVISRFVLGTDRKKQEWGVIGVNWHTVSLVEGRFALNLSTVNLSTVVWLDSGILRDRPTCRSGMPLIYRIVDRWPGDAHLAPGLFIRQLSQYGSTRHGETEQSAVGGLHDEHLVQRRT